MESRKTAKQQNSKSATTKNSKVSAYYRKVSDGSETKSEQGALEGGGEVAGEVAGGGGHVQGGHLFCLLSVPILISFNPYSLPQLNCIQMYNWMSQLIFDDG